MKKWIALVLVLACVFSVVGCSSDKVDKTKPVFETENVSSITFFAAPNSNEGVEVPEEYIAQITAWLGTFTLDEKADSDILAPGSNSISVCIVYADGSVVKNGLTTFDVDGTTYYMKSEAAPACYFEVFAQQE